MGAAFSDFFKDLFGLEKVGGIENDYMSRMRSMGPAGAGLSGGQRTRKQKSAHGRATRRRLYKSR